MKNSITLIVLLITSFLFSQSGINYKAVIKDASDNILASSPVSIQFIIYEGVALTNNVYQESHTLNTDANGFIIVNIGEGATGDIFSVIDWGNDDHFLNVQVNTGSGLVNLGTTQFMAVPYALEAKNVSGLSAIDEGNGIGWRLTDEDPISHGIIGLSSVDLTANSSSPGDYGATGASSFAAGLATTASGDYATAMGTLCVASGWYSTAIGAMATASGFISFAIGFDVEAESYISTAFGRHNVGGGLPNGWRPIDPLFEIGNGASDESRNNALTVLKSGDVGIGTNTPQERLHIANGRLRLGNETIEDTGSNQLSFGASLIPDANNAYRLGNSSSRWIGVWAVDGTINTSDRRDKENITDINYGLKEIQKLKPVSYNWKKRPEAGVKLGLIAQDLQTIIPEVVMSEDIIYSDDDSTSFEKKPLDRLGVYYSDLIPVLIKAIQEQQDIINLQKAELASQGSEIGILSEENKFQNSKIHLLSEEISKIQLGMKQMIPLETNHKNF